MGTGNKKFRAGNLQIDFFCVVVFKTISLLLSTIFCYSAVNTGPSCDDLEAFVSYLIQLVHGCDLERVGLLLRHVQRYVIKRYKARTLIFMHHNSTTTAPFPSPFVAAIYSSPFPPFLFFSAPPYFPLSPHSYCIKKVT